MNYIRSTIMALLAITSFTACEKIRSGSELQHHEISYIQKLGLLDKKEQVIKFYSNYKFKYAGNFFTEKRIAKYWIDRYDNKKTEIRSAFYKDIIAIDSTSNVPSTYCPYLLITRKDKSQFKVFVNGQKGEVKSFFKEVINTWSQQRSIASLPHRTP